METPFQQNIYLYSCSGTQTGHDPFVYEHSLGLITSGSMEVHTDNGLVAYPAGTLSLVKRRQLLKVIKQPDGQKPFASINIFLDQETLKKYSLEQAHFLIMQQNKRSTEVYLEVGFENLSHFSTAFKKEFGINASVV